MAHFAKLGVGDVVEEVIVVPDDVFTTEQEGVDWINNLFGTNDVWKQTSYNTRGGVHTKGGTPFRKNFAVVGGRYDSTRDAFLTKQPENSWKLDEDTCQYMPPIEYPTDGKTYWWNEIAYQIDNTQGWIERTE